MRFAPSSRKESIERKILSINLLYEYIFLDIKEMWNQGGMKLNLYKTLLAYRDVLLTFLDLFTKPEVPRFIHYYLHFQSCLVNIEYFNM